MEGDFEGEIPIGCPVFTEDGERLGTVKEVRGGFFKVDTSMAPDYWIVRDCVTTAGSEGVVLAVDKEHLDDVKVDPPAEAVEPAPDRVREGLLTGSVPPFAPIGWTEWEQVRPEHEREWAARFDGSDPGWSEVEPAVRFGHDTAADERYGGQSWEQAEPSLAEGYAAQGGADWERMRDHARRGWDRARGSGGEGPPA